MTLIVAIGCTDGLVFASDSASSDSEVGTKQPAKKIRTIPGQSILWASSGDVGLIQNIEEALKGLTLKNTPHKTRQEIKKRVGPVLKESMDSHVPYPDQRFSQPPCAITLFAFVQDHLPWILEIERNCGDTIFGEDYGYFAAIGSGKPWAQAVFRPHLLTKRDIRLGRIFAYRVLEDSINLAAGGLAQPIHLFSMSLDGRISNLDCDIVSISKTCELWRELEGEAVGQILAPGLGKPAETIARPPDPLSEKTSGVDQNGTPTPSA